jgi:cystathionine beta-synthase
VKYARNLPADRLPVVLFPDAGSRYLSKFYDNKWMRENGFLELEFGEVALGDLLFSKQNKQLFTASVGDPMRAVMATMRQNAISQMPVTNADGSLAGLLDEVDLLNHLLEDHQHSQEEPIDPLVQKAQAVFPPETTLDEAMPSLTAGFALIVADAGRPIGILTKIDVLDYVAGKI